MTNILDSHISQNANIIGAKKLKGKNLRSQIVASDFIEKYDLEKVLAEQDKIREDVLILNRNKKKQKKRIPFIALISTALISLILYKKVKK